jgi:hypothetical protein
MITLINISNIIRTRQTKYIKDKAEAITMAEVFREALEVIIALKAVAVFREAKAVVNISYYLHVRKSVIFVTS